MDVTNVGDWYSTPFRYFDFGPHTSADIKRPVMERGDSVIVGGGGLVSVNFAPHMERLATRRPLLRRLIAWGIGESLINDKQGGLVDRWEGPLPDYLGSFDLVGIRDHGTEYRWVPCASCMLPQLDREYAVEHELCIYEHKRIPVPLDVDVPRRSNDGNDVDATMRFLGSAETVITNSYHGAYWATLLGRRVVAIPNLSKMYGFRHPPAICAPSDWRRAAQDAVCFPEALEECRSANETFFRQVSELLGSAA